jgi:hypothetical protein
MTLAVIGSGLGRTGTKSLQSALNLLGFGPCHHMVEVFAHPESMPLWVEAGAGAARWDAIFENYKSAVDYPSAAHWRALAAWSPQAKIIHTVRDPQAWFESTQATIFAPDGLPARAMASNDAGVADFFKSFTGAFADHLHDRAFLTEYFMQHTEAVKAAIAPERLLIYQSSDGWAPLCEFLGVDIPASPYPAENSRSEFIARNLKL